VLTVHLPSASAKRIVGTGSPHPGRHGMHRDRATGYPVATPSFATRYIPHAWDERVFSCVHKSEPLGAKRRPAPLRPTFPILHHGRKYPWAVVLGLRRVRGRAGATSCAETWWGTQASRTDVSEFMTAFRG
jgi:hypothetical protein